jgi:hypothetical protein
MDPAGPNFINKPIETRLDATDAIFVDVIHTSTLGTSQQCGHVDFYVNGGEQQAGCPISFLSGKKRFITGGECV